MITLSLRVLGNTSSYKFVIIFFRFYETFVHSSVQITWKDSSMNNSFYQKFLTDHSRNLLIWSENSVRISTIQVLRSKPISIVFNIQCSRKKSSDLQSFILTDYTEFLYWSPRKRFFALNRKKNAILQPLCKISRFTAQPRPFRSSNLFAIRLPRALWYGSHWHTPSLDRARRCGAGQFRVRARGESNRKGSSGLNLLCFDLIREVSRLKLLY